jgi:putative aldouronate transport system permease protein
MSTPKYFYNIYTISGIWQSMGWSSIIYMSALASVDQQLYEAATVDGAGRWKQALHITLPSILPTVVIMLIMDIGGLLNVGYETIILLYRPETYETADVISTYVYRRGIEGGSGGQDFNLTTATGLFNGIVSYLLVALSNKVSNIVGEVGLW